MKLNHKQCKLPNSDNLPFSRNCFKNAFDRKYTTAGEFVDGKVIKACMHGYFYVLHNYTEYLLRLVTLSDQFKLLFFIIYMGK